MTTSKQKTSQVYESEKLIFAAWLCASGKATLMGTKPTGNGRQVSFVLSYTPTEKETADFFNGTAEISALKYATAISNLKSAAYENLRRHDNT